MRWEAANLRRAWRRLRRRVRRSRWLFSLHVLVIATVLVVGLPALLPLAASLHVRDRRRRRRAAETFACTRCGAILGAAALARADVEWAEHVAQLCREHPGYRFRLVRELDAVCIRCDAPYHYEEERRTFGPPQRGWVPPPAEPFFDAAEVARLVQGQPVREPLPFDPANDDGSIRRFYEDLVQRIERAQGLRARVEWGHYGCGYASFIEAWFYPADGSARVPPHQAGDERHAGLVVLLSRLSRFFVLGQDEKSWSANAGSGSLPDFSTVDDLTHPAVWPHVAPVTGLLTAAGLQRLSRADLAALLPPDVRVPTILSNEPFRQFDALFHWED